MQIKKRNYLCVLTNETTYLNIEKYINLIEINLVVIEIRGVENNLAVPVNNTLVFARNFFFSTFLAARHTTVCLNSAVFCNIGVV